MADQNVAARNDTPFDARRYWEERHRAHPDITAVGFLGLSPRFSELQYRSCMGQLERALRQYGLNDLSGRSVLDVGSGSGIWLDFWRRHGAEQVAGLDFAQTSVDRLKQKFPDVSITQADLSVSPLPLPQDRRFDLISAFQVLLHIVDPEGFRRAVANLGQHCAPGGWLIISDAFVQGQGYVPAGRYLQHNTVRTLADFREALEASGFTIESIRPTNVLINTPLEAPNRLAFRALLIMWKITRHWGRSQRWSRLLGPAMLVADRIACRLSSGGGGPSNKLIFARKRA